MAKQQEGGFCFRPDDLSDKMVQIQNILLISVAVAFVNIDIVAFRKPLIFPVHRPEGKTAFEHVAGRFKIFFGKFAQAAETDDGGLGRRFREDIAVTDFMARFWIVKVIFLPAFRGKKRGARSGVFFMMFILPFLFPGFEWIFH